MALIQNFIHILLFQKLFLLMILKLMRWGNFPELLIDAEKGIIN